jgi:S-methylmethionine-dependent homocysteine/selenocysteine methylase
MASPLTEENDMPSYRNALPQLAGDLYLTDAGLETDLIFNNGLEIREFAAHTLLPDSNGRQALQDYFRGFLSLAHETGCGFILDTPTWKAHPHWSDDLGESADYLRGAVVDAANLVSGLRDEFSGNEQPILLNGVAGPRGDAYAPDAMLAAREAEDYHRQQLGWFADTDVDMVSAITFTQADEAAGFANAAKSLGLPAVVSFTVETDGRLPTGQTLKDAIAQVDELSGAHVAYYMVNCAHPDHFSDKLESADWAKRIRGLRCNASRMSHAELDNSEVLDDGDPVELASQYREIRQTMPWVNVFGGCCGSDLRHVSEIARTLAD